MRITISREKNAGLRVTVEGRRAAVENRGASPVKVILKGEKTVLAAGETAER